jgi:hypothetical protein
MKKNKFVYLVQQGYYEPVAFSTLADAKAWLDAAGFRFKEKHAPYYWDNAEAAKSCDGDSEFRSWLMRVEVL